VACCLAIRGIESSNFLGVMFSLETTIHRNKVQAVALTVVGALLALLSIFGN